MTHERHADVLDHPGLHQARIEAVTQIVKAKVAEPSAFQPAEPAFADPGELLTVKGEHYSLLLRRLRQQGEQAICEGDLAPFPFGGFGFGYAEKPARQIHVFPPLAEDFASPHSGVKGRNDDSAQVV